MRKETTVFVSAENLIYELRVARSLARDLNRSLEQTQQSFMIEKLLDTLIGVIEDASTLFQPQDQSTATEAGLGTFPLHDSDN